MKNDLDLLERSFIVIICVAIAVNGWAVFELVKRAII